jgi:hypothetical protein
MDVKLRFAHVAMLAEQYENFVDFAADGMAFLGFDLTEMQADIAAFMQHGPRLRQVMAQRGEAKSTLAALYAVWRIIQRPSTRVLIVSAGEMQASEVATLVVRLIQTWDILECLRPDRMAGDRTSTEAFDVHYALKGLDKSPSVACVGITSNLPGKRADLLIPDDIETNKNGLTVTQRQQLLQLTKEFSSICTHGDILYLGTPQSKDSVYNTLPNRGFTVRIWPGRYPTAEEAEKYADRLAPYLAERIKADPSLQRGGGIDGTRGKPADPDRYNEEELIEKELDKGPEDFQLQYMLDTSLADAMRQQLKLSDLLVANFDSDRVPEIIVYQAAPKYAVELPAGFPITLCKMYYPVPVDCEFVRPLLVRCYIDPAGGGSDELAAACSFSVGPYVHVKSVIALRGGLSGDNPEKLCAWLARNGVNDCVVESNMGHGLFETLLRAELEKRGLGHIGVTSEYSTGQKERRIIDSLVSPMQRHRIIVHKDVFDMDVECGKAVSIEQRTQYSLWYQMANITTDRNSLVHDDRLEAVAGAVRLWKGVLADDETKAAHARAMAEVQKFVNDPMGYGTKRDDRRVAGARAIAHGRRARK